MQRDAIQILTDDHREVEGLFQKVESGSAGKKDVVAKIVRELSIHDAIEREYLYPAVRKHIADQGDHGQGQGRRGRPTITREGDDDAEIRQSCLRPRAQPATAVLRGTGRTR